MTTATRGLGTALQLDDGAGNYTTIAEVKDITGPALAADTVDVTNHSSTGGWEEHIATILRTGEIQFDVNFLPANATQNYAAGLINLMVNRTTRNYKVIFTNSGATAWILPSIVKGVQTMMPVAGVTTARVALKPTGAPTLA